MARKEPDQNANGSSKMTFLQKMKMTKLHELVVLKIKLKQHMEIKSVE